MLSGPHLDPPEFLSFSSPLEIITNWHFRFIFFAAMKLSTVLVASALAVAKLARGQAGLQCLSSLLINVRKLLMP